MVKKRGPANNNNNNVAVEVPVGTPVCPNGHLVVRCKVLRKWEGHIHKRVCNECSKDISRSEQRWRCLHRCDFDLCTDCYEQKRAASDAAEAAEGDGGSETEEAGENPTASMGLRKVDKISRSPSGTLRCNGFLTEFEPESLEVDPSMVAPFSLPQEALDPSHQYNEIDRFIVNPDGQVERFVHCNTELQAKEVRLLKEVQQLANVRKVTFYPHVSVLATRHLGTARGSSSKALELMEATQRWRKEYFKDGPVGDKQADVVEGLKSGMMYFCGRDPALRPILVLRATRVPAKWLKEGKAELLLRCLIFIMEYFSRYMCVPGRVENLVLLIDLAGLSSFGVPMGPLKEIYKVMSGHYPGRLKNVFICNMPSALSWAYSAAKTMLTDRQKRKLNVVNKVSELTQFMAPHQLEEDLGGTRKAITTFYPFPVGPGPYDLGSTQRKEADSVPNCHEALDGAAVEGHLWDPRRGKDKNTALGFTEKAPEIMRACGFPFKEASQKRQGGTGSQEVNHIEEFSDEEPLGPEPLEAIAVKEPAMCGFFLCSCTQPTTAN
mmetsp:Transcript_582/g.1866  ORF Transcript_582/g.1866 Transcript_582/m.1866 type:complete len:550 (+) Transcript_582:73-1722(+)